MKNKPAGGIGSRVVTDSKSARKIEPRAQGIRPGAAAQIGRPWAITPPRWQEADQGGRATAQDRGTTKPSAQTTMRSQRDGSRHPGDARTSCRKARAARARHTFRFRQGQPNCRDQKMIRATKEQRLWVRVT